MTFFLISCDQETLRAVAAADMVLTNGGAHTKKLEDQKGCKEVGKRADVVVLSHNLFELDPYEISDAYVTMTIFDGRTVYQRSD